MTRELIEQGVDFQDAYLGNYIIIDHRNEEFGAYVHLSENTITVRARDGVKQGQVIGRIGNTGNSTEPLLHFQLMDSRDYPGATGLPVTFKNIPFPIPYGSDWQEANCLARSDYLFVDAQ